MKKLYATVFVLGWLLFAFACSSRPPGTDAVGDLEANSAARIGQQVVVVGLTETKTGYSSMNLFKLFDGNKSIWVVRNADTDEPPQGVEVRVTGILQKKDFNILGNVLCIEANKIAME